MEFLQHTWYILIGVLLAGYAILDGFDLGIGVLFPFLAKNDQEKRVLINAVGPFWDGNEVWLLTGGGALFAAFPNVYATVFSGFYLALMLVLFALIFRAVSMEFWAYDKKRKGVWQGAFVIGSLLPALLYGVALGNVIQGIPIDAKMEFTGNFFTLLRPFPLALGVLGLIAFLLQGTGWTIYKTEGAIQQRARTIANRLIYAFGVMFIITLILALRFIPNIAGKWLAYLFVVTVLIACFLFRKFMLNKQEYKGFIASSGIWLGLWALVGAWHYPNLVRASNTNGVDMTLSNTSSSQLTLTVMLIIALIGMPIVIAYTIYVYKLFKGKVKVD